MNSILYYQKPSGIYSEFDIVTHLLPFVTKNLYSLINEKNDRNDHNKFDQNDFMRLKKASVNDKNNIVINKRFEYCFDTSSLNKEYPNDDYIIFVLFTSQGDISETTKSENETWSVLFLGSTEEKILLKGIQSRQEILKLIPNEFWNYYQEKRFLLTDGTVVTKEYIRQIS